MNSAGVAAGKISQKCHMQIDDKNITLASEGHIVPDRSMSRHLHRLKRSKVQRSTQQFLITLQNIHAGMSTAEIDKLVCDYTTEHGGDLLRHLIWRFSKSVCTSINNEVCHGIPDENILFLEEGDIINVDVLYHSQWILFRCIPNVCHRIVRPGEKDSKSNRRMCRTWSAAAKLERGHLGILPMQSTHTLRQTVTLWLKTSAVTNRSWISQRTFCELCHWKGTEMVLVPGMMFTIEPMINEEVRFLCRRRQLDGLHRRWLSTQIEYGACHRDRYRSIN